MVDKSANWQEDAAYVDAYERRVAGGAPEDVPAQWRDEIEQLVKLHKQLAAEPLPEVAAGVRGVVMAAAVQATQDKPASVWSTLLHLLLKPGPILVTATVLAVAVAVSLRDDQPAPAASPTVGAVAMVDPAAPTTVAAASAPMPAPADTADVAVQPLAAPQEPAVAGALPKGEAGVVHKMDRDGAAAFAGGAKLAVRNTAPDMDKAGDDRVLADDEAKPAGAPSAPPVAGAADQAVRAEDLLQHRGMIAAKPASIAPGSAEMGGVAASGGAAPSKRAAVAPEEVAAAPAPAREAKAEGARSAKEEADLYADGARPTATRSAAPAPKTVAADHVAPPQSTAALRAEIERTTDPAKRKALLTKLLALAQKQGDAANIQWANKNLAPAQNQSQQNQNQQNQNSQNQNVGGPSATGKAAPQAPQAPAAEKAPK